ncbi:uncharacterized protein LOC100820909 [Brachypodium distachyon]|uniref:uncharacterized protein LOC100820909 n=1 Tax=Brachypodium distachyon TaxID=15368 RepID=UPI00052FF539|nr:uncharacterized protein LOC100820909 [Brachypodium distachyon]|eukprot:XP_010236242.1 uncharacterized protein LOC100820909 [Brachypodium distachyon]
MATHSDTTHTDYESQNSEDSTIAAYVDEIVWDFINNPVEAEIEAQILAQAEAQQNEAAAQSRRHIERNREAGHFRLMADYFDDNPVYTDKQFRRRFDAFGKPGHSPHQKCTAAMRMLAYVCPVDSLDENLRIAASTTIEVLTKFARGRALEVEFTVNANVYKKGYYLADGIYPEWATLLKTIPLPQCEKDKRFAQHQESRKDVEGAFGVLQRKFAIIRNPAQLWDRSALADIMYACVILHNMIVEDER